MCRQCACGGCAFYFRIKAHRAGQGRAAQGRAGQRAGTAGQEGRAGRNAGHRAGPFFGPTEKKALGRRQSSFTGRLYPPSMF